MKVSLKFFFFAVLLSIFCAHYFSFLSICLFSGAKGPSGAAGTTNRAVKSKHLVASLAVALAAVFADSSESFGRKFTTPVEESFTFTTDTKVSLTDDFIYNRVIIVVIFALKDALRRIPLFQHLQCFVFNFALFFQLFAHANRVWNC